MRLIRVLHISQRDDTSMGGAPRVAAELTRRLPDHGIDAHCLFLYGPPGPFGASLGHRAHYLGLKSSREFWNYWKFVRFILGFQPDILHHHDPLIWPQIASSLIPGVLKVNHAHMNAVPPGELTHRDRCSSLAERAGTRKVLAISNYVRDSHIRYNHVPPDKVVVVSNGVDAGRYTVPTAAQKQLARESFGIPTGAIVVGQVGRLHMAFKGTDDLLEAVARLPEHYWGLVAGDGGDFENLQRLSDDLGVAHRIAMPGHIDDPIRAFHAMDVYAFTSHYEPFGLVIAEAMACGIPVVGFDCPGGSRDMLDGTTGWALPQRNPESMALAIMEVAAHPEATRRVTLAARERILTRYDWDRLAEQLAGHYHDLPQGTR